MIGTELPIAGKNVGPNVPILNLTLKINLPCLDLVIEPSLGSKRWDLVIKIALLMNDSLSTHGFGSKVN